MEHGLSSHVSSPQHIYLLPPQSTEMATLIGELRSPVLEKFTGDHRLELY